MAPCLYYTSEAWVTWNHHRRSNSHTTIPPMGVRMVPTVSKLLKVTVFITPQVQATLRSPAQEPIFSGHLEMWFFIDGTLIGHVPRNVSNNFASTRTYELLYLPLLLCRPYRHFFIREYGNFTWDHFEDDGHGWFMDAGTVSRGSLGKWMDSNPVVNLNDLNHSGKPVTV
ncbi:hypothetical protein ARMSODRAFT_981788 [Armillaria solidipes]|uniref:Uncharacterized protein n=1 Tax=Armillaria solidipes TaxID=1076256 RepID=A0A2H3AQK5_9AGAR|nr:hypothetical protein ARMSODRAFT_981788 [Armillaria solidipes]